MTSKRLDPEEFRLQGILREASEHLDKLRAIFDRIGMDEFDEEFKLIDEAIREIWRNR